MAFSTGKPLTQRSRCGECLAGQRSASASAIESRPTPKAAEVIFLKGDVLPTPVLLPLREMIERGREAAPKAGNGEQPLREMHRAGARSDPEGRGCRKPDRMP
ncbi:MAG: hypothetical protein DRJ65_16780 [Acidobacteria bacterium]|nr:MAG: hypothetical protein DRJ65_16780 [Acidobacteriota bacterium]